MYSFSGFIFIPIYLCRYVVVTIVMNFLELLCDDKYDEYVADSYCLSCSYADVFTFLHACV
jgi:hypothetical protein